MKKSQVMILLALFATSTLFALAPVEAQEVTERIVYTRSTAEFDAPEETEVFVMDADGTDVVQVTDNDREDAFASLSPDRTRVAFSRRARGQFDLFVMKVDGSDVTRLIQSPDADEVLPTWSPDGRKIAYTATTATSEGWQSDIYRIRLSDGRFRRLTYTPATKEFAPDWAPDGSEIAFTKQNQATERYGIAAVKPDATGLRWIVINPDSASGYTDVNPSWSPNSQWIAFSRDHGADPYVDIFKVKRDGSEITPVTSLNELAENPVWGIDDRILFMHNEGLAVVPADGGEVVHLTEVGTGRPYWWPDW